MTSSDYAYCAEITVTSVRSLCVSCLRGHCWHHQCRLFFLIFRYHRGGDLPSRPPLSILSFPSPPFRVSLFCVSVLRPSSPLCVNPTRGRETSDGSSSWHRVCFLLFLSFLSSDVCGEGAKIGALPSQVFRLGVDHPHGVGVYG